MNHNLTQDRPRRILSIPVGNAIQTAGAIFGFALLWLGTQAIQPNLRTLAMIAGYLLIYFNTHSLAHYAAGGLTGIKFKHYSIGGSSHASSYPLPIRAFFQRMPFFAAATDPASMKSVGSYAKAFMFSAGILSTVIFSTYGVFIVYQAKVPGATALFIFNFIWQASSLISEMRSSGDLGKALNAVKNK